MRGDKLRAPVISVFFQCQDAAWQEKAQKAAKRSIWSGTTPCNLDINRLVFGQPLLDPFRTAHTFWGERTATTTTTAHISSGSILGGVTYLRRFSLRRQVSHLEIVFL